MTKIDKVFIGYNNKDNYMTVNVRNITFKTKKRKVFKKIVGVALSECKNKKLFY